MTSIILTERQTLYRMYANIKLPKRKLTNLSLRFNVRSTSNTSWIKKNVNSQMQNCMQYHLLNFVLCGVQKRNETKIDKTNIKSLLIFAISLYKPSICVMDKWPC
jgi:hypothetical protein